MSKVLTFSRNFPSYHPKAGQPTFFVEKCWFGFIVAGEVSIGRVAELSAETGIGDLDIYAISASKLEPKHHTIRSGNRWKVGDKFSPRVWSGKPYNSKQIIIAPDIEIKKVWDIVFTPKDEALFLNAVAYYPFGYEEVLKKMASNDGLLVEDLVAWFNKPITGQIICWNEDISY